ncbi:hypothetical protein AAHC03_019456 [Spirometra sp. Aus1]
MDMKPDAARILGPPVIRLTPSGPRPIVVPTISSTTPVVVGQPPPQKQKVYKVIAFVTDTKPGVLPRPSVVPVIKTEHQQPPNTHPTNSPLTIKPESSGARTTLISLLGSKPRQVSPNNALSTLPSAAATTKNIVTTEENFAPSANCEIAAQEPPPPPTEVVHWATEQLPSTTCPSHQPPAPKEHHSSRASLLASHLHQIAELAALASSTDLQQMSIHLQQLEDEWREELLNNGSTAADGENSRFPSSDSASPSRTPLSDATEACEGEYGVEEEEENDCEEINESERGKSTLNESYESGHADATTSSSGHHRSIAPILLQLGQTDVANRSSHGSLRTAPKRKVDALRN